MRPQTLSRTIHLNTQAVLCNAAMQNLACIKSDKLLDGDNTPAQLHYQRTLISVPMHSATPVTASRQQRTSTQPPETFAYSRAGAAVVTRYLHMIEQIESFPDSQLCVSICSVM